MTKRTNTPSARPLLLAVLIVAAIHIAAILIVVGTP